ncbi:TIGR03560 family F420-dependent LLM class oxidoreductase [Microbacterium marinilacus]|uniref:LLM class F420-dependent oxidoreductase n=1 Tax=Microbacterium marinilacus TaxID=415209 RepID=A0ABP7BK84_9MICO|nr:TIGR03560 family F420-dependent LLM class oxidoreductase [Microbacterium marinilacus]MBY0689765.1 TIGR03560 family F420-dependent LLM class oxidoreductase [Microbacterium marinilacus]
MRFGIFIPQGWRFDLVDIDPAAHWSTMRSLAVRADAGPWESLWVYDHFHTTPVPSDEATHEAWTLMSAFAASTSRIRLGQMCTCMGYRNPAYLAKVAATVDHVSAGRVEMGIGGGWYEHEWRAYGYGFPEVPDRLRALREGVEILSQAWRTGSATLDGAYFQADGAIVRPLPIQEGGIPIWIAGAGEKVTLRIAAEYASYTNFNGGVEGFRHKSEVLRGHTDRLGRDFAEITRSANFNTVVGETEADVRERLRAIEARVAPYTGDATAGLMEKLTTGEGLVGTVEQVTERLAAMREVGLGYAIHYFPESAYDLSGVELFEQRVIPALSA